MKYYSEKKAEKILKDFGFNIVPGVYCKKEREISSALISLGLPCVMKISGDKIVHKNKLGGIELNIETYAQAIETYKKFKKIKNCKEVVIQKKISFNKEFILGIKKTKDFGHVILFGEGGTEVEEKKDIAFRVYPLSEEDSLSILKEVKITKEIGKKELIKIANVIKKLSDFLKENENIEELDINPLVFGGTGPIILDARITFE